MSSSSREQVDAVLDLLDAAADQLLELGFGAFTTPERFTVLERIETVARRLPVPGHELINELDRQASRAEMGGRLSHALADRLHITRTDAKRRIREAADLGPRHSLTGEPITPQLAGTAAGQRAGELGSGHVAVIRGFVHRLPGFVDASTREHAEQDLAREAAAFRPEQAAALADIFADCLNPDGTYTDADRARRRSLILGKQQADGMSRLHGYISPKLRATIEAVWAKLAAPGMCNPESPTPVIDGAAPQEAIDSDTRSAGQRHHDALEAALRALLASGELGQHNGLPASIIVTTTLAELEAGAGKGRTGGGSVLPMSDVIRLASHAHHYLCIFDQGKAIGLYHTRRLASPGQRIVLYAKDRGCSHPGCDVAGYYCEVHHVVDWAKSRRTHIDELAFGCGGHHPIVQPGGWTTRTRANGDIEWIPPPHLDHGQPRTNTFHHPEKLLHHNDNDNNDADDDGT